MSGRCHIVSQPVWSLSNEIEDVCRTSWADHVVGTHVPTKYQVVELSNGRLDRRVGQPSANEPCSRICWATMCQEIQEQHVQRGTQQSHDTATSRITSRVTAWITSQVAPCRSHHKWRHGETSQFISEEQQQASKQLKIKNWRRSSTANHTNPTYAAKQKRPAELKRVQAASNGKDNDKQGQEGRYDETIKWQKSLQNLKGYWSH